MANELKMAKVLSILALREQGWSCRRIARELGVHRETVARHLRLAREGPKPANPLTGSDGAGGSKPANPLTGSTLSLSGRSGPVSESEPLRALIIEKLTAGLSAQRIYQDLKSEHGFRASYSSVQRYVKRLRSSSPRPYRRMECEPGAEAQVDFGPGAPIVTAAGKRRRTHLFRSS